MRRLRDYWKRRSPGAVFGELALTDNKPRSASIIAVEPMSCYWISSREFARLRDEQPDLAVDRLAVVVAILAERLRSMTSMLGEMEAWPAFARKASAVAFERKWQS